MAGEGRKAKEERVSFRSLQSAENCLVQANYGRAFAHYLLVLKLTPDKKHEIKNNFALALREWGQQLEQQCRLEDLFMCYQQACELFPECETMLNNMGSQLFRLGYIDEAACCFRRALKIDPDFLGARENLDNVCSQLVERWHFRMLNDTTRNRQYQEAIHKAVESGHNTILDIGTGTGLLSLFAVEAGARNVYGCEVSKTMYEVSCDVVSANQMEDRIHLIHKVSTDLEIPQDLAEWVTLVVTETFDAGLLGEHILDTLHHAWQHLLAGSLDSTIKPQVIPSGATVYVCGVESEDIRKQNRLIYPGLRYLDLSAVNISCKTTQNRRQPLPKVPSTDPIKTKSDLENAITRKNEMTNGSGAAPEKSLLNGKTGTSEALLDTSETPSANCSNGDAVATTSTDNAKRTMRDGPSERCQSSSEKKPFSKHSSQPYPCTMPNGPFGGPRWAWTEKEHEDVKDWEPYTAERLSQLPHGYKILTNVIKAFHFDFCDFSSIHSYRRGFLHHLHLPVILQGKLDAIVMWFDLELDAELNLSSMPDANSCWEQAIFPVLPEHLKNADANENFLVKPGDALNVTCSCHDNAMHFRCSSICREISPGCFPSSLESVSWLESWRLEQSLKASCRQENPGLSKPTYCLDRQELERLNDLDFNTALCNALEALKMQYLTKRDFTVFDMSPGISVFILQALKLGAHTVGTITDAANQQLLCSLAEANELEVDRIEFEGEESLTGEIEHAEWDVLITDLVSTCGCLHQQVLEDIAMARVMRLKHDGLVVPHCAKVYGMVIESHFLLNDSAIIDNDHTLGFRIAEFMNDFQMTTHVDIDLNTLDYKALSEPFELFSLKFSEPDAAKEIPAYLEQTNTFQSLAVETGQVTAVVYWFELWLTPDSKICTLDPKMHWSQAAVLQKNNLEVSTRTPFTVKAVCKNSCIDVSISLL